MRHEILLVLLLAATAYAVDPTPIPQPEDASAQLILGPFTDVDGTTAVTPTRVVAQLNSTKTGTAWSHSWTGAELVACGTCSAGTRKNENCSTNGQCGTGGTCVTDASNKCAVTTIPYSAFALSDRGPSPQRMYVPYTWRWTDGDGNVQQGRGVFPVDVTKSPIDSLHAATPAPTRTP